MTGHASEELEVVWPLHRSHYLSPMLTDEDLAMHSDPVSVDDTPPPAPDAITPGRELAVRALLAGADCLQQRVSDLLGVSRRTIGRMADADLVAVLRDPQALEGARIRRLYFSHDSRGAGASAPFTSSRARTMSQQAPVLLSCRKYEWAPSAEMVPT